jgi:hypothetical protein
MPRHSLNYARPTHDGAWSAEEVAILALAGVVTVANVWLARAAHSRTDDWADLIVLLYLGPVVNAALAAAALAMAALWKWLAPTTRLGASVLAAFFLPVGGYLLLAVFGIR